MIEYGIFTDEGCIEHGFIDPNVAELHRQKWYNDDDAHVERCCDYHPEEPHVGCQECDDN